MDDQFDKDLSNHIKQVFDSYEDPAADEGWLQLRKKFPEEQGKRRPIAWLWWSAAAILLLLIGLGVWRYSLEYKPGLTTIKKQNPAQHENLMAHKTSPAINQIQKPAIKNQQQTMARQSAATPVNPKSGSYTPPSVNTFSHNKTPAIVSNLTDKKIFAVKKPGNVIPPVNQPPVNQLAAGSKAGNIQSAINQPPANQLASVNKADSIKSALNQPPVNLQAVVQPNKPVASQDTVKQPKRQKSIASMFANDNTPQTKHSDKKGGNIHLGIYAATYFNYAKGSGNQANVGGGATAEIKITDHLKLVTGITVAQNSMTFNGGVPTSTAATSFFAPSAGADAAPLLSAYSIKSAITVASDPAFKNYDASLVGLDIPVNLKYDFNPQKSTVYFMAGLSSGTFINETYTYQYNYPALASPTLQQTQDATTRRSFDSFYFGKMLNVAFGVGYPLGKNRLIIEPFLKYPLGGLGTQNIQFGSGGINLKFTFPTSGR
jgi:hypothetical protein